MRDERFVGSGEGNLRQMAAEDEDIKKILAGDIRAGHKIQINFGPGRSGLKDFKALLTLWESGKHFHGGGDAQIYFCMDHRVFEGNDQTTPPSALPLMRSMIKNKGTEWGCGSPITDADIRGPMSMCPGCKNLIPCQYLTGQMPFHGSVAELAELTTHVFHKLNDDADIYCKYDKTDIRYATQETKEGADKARRLRGLFIYPLYRILQDIGSGASLEGRFKAFFLA